jgi:hypothetical protein
METGAGKLAKKKGISISDASIIIENRNAKKSKNPKLSGLTLKQKPGEVF